MNKNSCAFQDFRYVSAKKSLILLMDLQEVLTFPQIKDEKWCLQPFFSQIATHEYSITTLIKKNQILLPNVALRGLYNNQET